MFNVGNADRVVGRDVGMVRYQLTWAVEWVVVGNMADSETVRTNRLGTVGRCRLDGADLVVRQSKLNASDFS